VKIKGKRRYRDFIKRGVVKMEHDFYTGIGYAVVWCLKFIFIPIGVGVSVNYIVGKLLQPQPKRQRKKRFK